MPETRQLAAIMFTDIQGYTALMQQDESKAIELGLPDPDHFITWYDMAVYEKYQKAIHEAQRILNREPLSIETH
jgi:hypothetical protein